MSTSTEEERDLDREQARAAIEEMRANVAQIQAQTAQWQAQNAHWQADHELRARQARREDRRLLLYGVLVLAATLAAGGALWEAIRP